MTMDDNDGQMIFRDLVGRKLPDIRLTGEEKPRKTSPMKLVPTGNRTRARCVASAHATTCSTAVDFFVFLWCKIYNIKIIKLKKKMEITKFTENLVLVSLKYKIHVN